jgi:hypothetical protein
MVRTNISIAREVNEHTKSKCLWFPNRQLTCPQHPGGRTAPVPPAAGGCGSTCSASKLAAYCSTSSSAPLPGSCASLPSSQKAASPEARRCSGCFGCGAAAWAAGAGGGAAAFCLFTSTPVAATAAGADLEACLASCLATSSGAAAALRLPPPDPGLPLASAAPEPSLLPRPTLPPGLFAAGLACAAGPEASAAAGAAEVPRVGLDLTVTPGSTCVPAALGTSSFPGWLRALLLPVLPALASSAVRSASEASSEWWVVRCSTQQQAPSPHRQRRRLRSSLGSLTSLAPSSHRWAAS